MVTARKLLLTLGTHHAPQGQLRASPQRMQSWVNTFKQMESRGIKIPIPWGHQPKAVPGDPEQRAKDQFYRSAYNAGYLDDLRIGPSGELEMEVDCPGCELDTNGNLVAWRRLEDGQEVKTAIREVSAGIRDWKDGQGNLWKDALIHVALTTLPVVANQGGFRALSAFAFEDDAPVYYLSLSSPKELATMPFPPKEGADAPEEDVDTVDVEEPAFAPVAAPTAGQDNARLAAAIGVLEAHGLHLPHDTTIENILERICVAGHAKAKGVDEEEDEEEPVAPGDQNAPVVEEQRPVMLSLATATTAREKALLSREQESHKARQLKRILRLEKRGMSPADANRLREALSGYQLSLTEEGELVPADIDRELEIADRYLPAKAGAYLSTADVQPRPYERDAAKNLAAQEEAGDELAALAGAPARKK